MFALRKYQFGISAGMYISRIPKRSSRTGAVREMSVRNVIIEIWHTEKTLGPRARLVDSPISCITLCCRQKALVASCEAVRAVLLPYVWLEYRRGCCMPKCGSQSSSSFPPLVYTDTLCVVLEVVQGMCGNGAVPRHTRSLPFDVQRQ